MNPSTQTARAMSDTSLAEIERTLTKSIPADQALLSAVLREQRRRRKPRVAQAPVQTNEETQ